MPCRLAFLLLVAPAALLAADPTRPAAPAEQACQRGQSALDRDRFEEAIGQFQLIQLKLAKMEVARMNIQNMVFRQLEMAAAGKQMGLAEASACKPDSAETAMEVALEAVQLHGGNGYMAEFQVEQLCRDAKVLQIYAGTDEIQVSEIARTLLAG